MLNLLCDIMTDDPQSVFCGLRLVLKSQFGWINNSGVIAMYGFFLHFGLKLMPILESFGALFLPHDVTPKRPSLDGNTSV